MTQTKVRCNDCRDYFEKTTLTWNDEDGWHALCESCRLVPALTQAGRLVFIKVGGE